MAVVDMVEMVETLVETGGLLVTVVRDTLMRIRRTKLRGILRAEFLLG